VLFLCSGPDFGWSAQQMIVDSRITKTDGSELGKESFRISIAIVVMLIMSPAKNLLESPN